LNSYSEDQSRLQLPDRLELGGSRIVLHDRIAKKFLKNFAQNWGLWGEGVILGPREKDSQQGRFALRGEPLQPLIDSF